MSRRLKPLAAWCIVAASALVIVAVLSLWASAAGAYWATLGSGTGTVSTGTLPAPTAVTATPTPGTGSVSVSWTAPATNLAPLTYYVQRIDSAATTAAACGTSAASTITTTTCTDATVALGSYRYQVVAVFKSWTSTSALSPSVTVAKASQTITFTAPSSASVGDQAPLTATASSQLPVRFSSATTAICTVSGSTVTYRAVGQCTISADQDGNTYNDPAPTVTRNVTVTKVAQTITFTSTAPSAAKVGTTYTVTASSTSGLPVTFGTTTPSVCRSTGANGATITAVGVGPCTVTADQGGDATYQAAPRSTQTYSVTGIAPTITSVSPSSINNGTTVTVKIIGTGFQATASVLLSDTAFVIQSTTYVSPTEIDVVVKNTYGNNRSRSTDVTVTNPDGSSVTRPNAIANA